MSSLYDHPAAVDPDQVHRPRLHPCGPCAVRRIPVLAAPKERIELELRAAQVVKAQLGDVESAIGRYRTLLFSDDAADTEGGRWCFERCVAGNGSEWRKAKARRRTGHSRQRSLVS